MKKFISIALIVVGVVVAVPLFSGVATAHACGSDYDCPPVDDCGCVPVNIAPVCQAIPAQTGMVGNSMTFSLRATDRDGDRLNYSGLNLPAGASVDSSTGVFSWIPNRTGSRTITMQASDGEDGCSVNVPITINGVPAPAPAPAPAPVTNTNTNNNGNTNTNVNTNTNTINIRIYGNGSVYGSGARITGMTTCNDGMDNDDDGRIDYNDSDCDAYGAENGNNVRRNSNSPRFTSTPITFAREGSLYIYNAVARDNDNDQIRYTLTQNPIGMSIDAFTGIIRWTPSFAQGGISYPVTVAASDSAHVTTQSYQIFVTDVTPVVTTTPTNTGTGAVLSAQAADNLYAFNIRVDIDEDRNSVVSWETTQPSHGRVIFGRASQGDRKGTDFTGLAQYEFSTPETQEISTIHRVILGQLESERVYYFRVVSTSGSKIDVSTERSFAQLPSGETLNSSGFASALETFGGFLVSPWFLLLIIVVLVVFIILRRRSRADDLEMTNEPLEVSVEH